MDTLSFSVADRILVKSESISREISERLQKRISQFEVQWQLAPEKRNADIVIKQVHELWPVVPGQAIQMDALYGFWVTVKNNIATLVLFHKGKAIISVSFSESITINFSTSTSLKHAKLVGKLYIVLLYCLRVCLQSKSSMLIHGSAFTQTREIESQSTFLLLGQRGIRKTMLSLTLMRRGWQYIADDKFVLEKRKAYRYQRNLLIRDHHFEQLPWLQSHIPHADKYLRNKRWRKLFRKILYRFVPKKLLPNEDRLLNKGINCPVAEIFPELISQQGYESQQVFILKNGEEFSVQEIDKSSAIRDIQLLQRMANSEFNDMDDQLSFTHCPYVFTVDEDELAKHLPDKQYFLISIPYGMSVEAICDEIILCTNCQ